MKPKLLRCSQPTNTTFFLFFLSFFFLFLLFLFLFLLVSGVGLGRRHVQYRRRRQTDRADNFARRSGRKRQFASGGMHAQDSSLVSTAACMCTHGPDPATNQPRGHRHHDKRRGPQATCTARPHLELLPTPRILGSSNSSSRRCPGGLPRRSHGCRY